MPHRLNDTILILTDNGEIEFDVIGDKVTVNQTDLEPSYIAFDIEKEDWDALKKFIDNKFSKSNG